MGRPSRGVPSSSEIGQSAGNIHDRHVDISLALAGGHLIVEFAGLCVEGVRREMELITPEQGVRQ